MAYAAAIIVVKRPTKKLKCRIIGSRQSSQTQIFINYFSIVAGRSMEVICAGSLASAIKFHYE
jgi:hypothetical protein